MNTKPQLEDRKDTYSFIIGDVQGRNDLLTLMLEKLKKDTTIFPLATNDKIILMGNFIHRRGNTQDIMDTIKSFKLQNKDQFEVLLGKPEMQWLKNRQSFYSQVVGKSVVNSYRTRKYGNKDNTLDVKEFIQDMQWLSDNGRFSYQTNAFFATTGGVDPKRPLDKQIPQALPYMEKEVVKLKKPLDKIIVHGTVTNAGKGGVKVLKTRVSINTNPLKTNRLSCVVIHNETGKVEEVFFVEKELESKKTS